VKITIVHIHPEGDGVTAMYINDELYASGDYYNDKIDDWICGFIEGLEYTDVAFNVINLYVLDSYFDQLNDPDWECENMLLDVPKTIDAYPEGSLSETY